VDLALANGGRDNVTVVVANYRRPTAGEDPAG
jgi:serine/threonine protein phosphatase PrpC